MALRFVSGQRWLSQTEPELGLGLVIATDTDTVTILFHSSETTRVYTVENPPLTRVRFSMGDTLKTQEGKAFTVEEVVEENGVCTYITKGKKIEESRLADSLTFSKPIDRLLNGQVDDKAIYNLRHRALYRRFKTYRGHLRGLLSGRFHPVAHQLYVAIQATRTQFPRVLLADEPGLGRRIEMGLILQRLQLAGSADRVLYLVSQDDMAWAELELKRRFGFEFTTFGAETKVAKKVTKSAAKKAAAAAAASTEPERTGVFAEGGNWVIMPLESLKAKIAKDVAGGAFDVMVVDGAEQLEWSEASGGNALYKAVEEAAANVRSLILVTPMGPEVDLAGHEARVRLLDPEDFGTPRKYHRYRNEQQPLTDFLTTLTKAYGSSPELEALAQPFIAEDTKAKESFEKWRDGKEHERDILIEHLLDAQESGRRIFRNTRSSIRKLPTHDVEWVMLEEKEEVRDELREEYKNAAKLEPAAKEKLLPSALDAPIATWISDIISPPVLPPAIPLPKSAEPPPPPPPPPKALVICANRGRALAAAKALSKRIPDKIVLISDEDRSGLPADTAAIVVGLEDMCGRSFSGVDFLLLWDLPQTPAEARLATSVLDFATSNMIKIYVPYVEETPQYFVAKWLHDGVDCMAGWSAVQDTVATEFQKSVLDLAKKLGGKQNSKLETELHAIIQKTQAAHETHLKKLEKGRDVLLELASCRPHFADQAANRMLSSDDDAPLDMYMNRVLEQCGVTVDAKQGPRRALAKRNPDAALPFDYIPKDGVELVYNRKIAATRESATFITWDHELIGHATRRLISTSTGNTAYVVWEDDRAQVVLLEGIFILEPPVAPAHLQVSRYMPPTPVRVVISHEQEDLSAVYTTDLVNKNVRNGRREWLRNNARPLHNLVPPMLRVLSQRADTRGQELAQKASNQMEQTILVEIARLQRMAPSPSRTTEIQRLTEQQTELKKVILGASLRLDSLRLLRRGPSGKGI